MTDQEPVLAHEARRISTKQAAELLGVKPETVYAYVSRGQLSSRRSTGGRGSTFDAKEVEALARRNRREPAEGSPAAGNASAAELAAAHVGVDGLGLHAQQLGRFLGAEPAFGRAGEGVLIAHKRSPYP